MRLPALAQITFVTALAGLSAVLGIRWIEDPLHRVILWGLLVWLLLESIEAVLFWNRHPWKPCVVATWLLLKDNGRAVLALPMAFLLTGMGIALIYTAVGRTPPDDYWMLIGILVIFGAIAIAMLAVPNHWETSQRRRNQRRGTDT